MAGEEWERVVEVDMLGVWRTVRAALRRSSSARPRRRRLLGLRLRQRLPQQPLCGRQGGGRVLGRALRAELTPLGSSASVAYFGWVDTRMVQDAAEQQHFDRLQNQLPAFMKRRIEPAEAAAAVVRGIEERSPRIFAPRWWRIISAFRGILNPLLDRRLGEHPDPASITRDIEEETAQRAS